MKRGTATVTARELRRAIGDATGAERRRRDGRSARRARPLAARVGGGAARRPHRRLRQRRVRPAARRPRPLPRSRAPRGRRAGRGRERRRVGARAQGPGRPMLPGGRSRRARRRAARRRLVGDHLQRADGRAAAGAAAVPTCTARAPTTPWTPCPSAPPWRLRRAHADRRRPEGSLDARPAARPSARAGDERRRPALPAVGARAHRAHWARSATSCTPCRCWRRCAPPVPTSTSTGWWTDATPRCSRWSRACARASSCARGRAASRTANGASAAPRARVGAGAACARNATTPPSTCRASSSRRCWPAASGARRVIGFVTPQLRERQAAWCYSETVAGPGRWPRRRRRTSPCCRRSASPRRARRRFPWRCVPSRGRRAKSLARAARWPAPAASRCSIPGRRGRTSAGRRSDSARWRRASRAACGAAERGHLGRGRTRRWPTAVARHAEGHATVSPATTLNDLLDAVAPGQPRGERRHRTAAPRRVGRRAAGRAVRADAPAAQRPLAARRRIGVASGDLRLLPQAAVPARPRRASTTSASTRSSRRCERRLAKGRR